MADVFVWCLAAMVGGCFVALVVEIGREVACAIRYRRVRRELAATPVRPVPPTRSATRDRAELDRPALHAVRPAESRDPGAARVLAFRLALEQKGRYVHELDIEQRLN